MEIGSYPLNSRRGAIKNRYVGKNVMCDPPDITSDKISYVN
jgi:hypothetical protein